MERCIFTMTLCCTLLLPSSTFSQDVIPILQYSDENNHHGSYMYSYRTGNGISVDEEGALKNAGQEGLEAQTARGCYSYTSPEGKFVAVSWYADETGFHPRVSISSDSSALPPGCSSGTGVGVPNQLPNKPRTTPLTPSDLHTYPPETLSTGDHPGYSRTSPPSSITSAHKGYPRVTPPHLFPPIDRHAEYPTTSTGDRPIHSKTTQPSRTSTRKYPGYPRITPPSSLTTATPVFSPIDKHAEYPPVTPSTGDHPGYLGTSPKSLTTSAHNGYPRVTPVVLSPIDRSTEFPPDLLAVLEDIQEQLQNR